jgi:hypothetical protein
LKLLSTDADGSFGGTFAATRDLLVLGAFEAKAQFDEANVPAKASLTSAKATGVQKVEVTFNKPLDNTAKFSLKRGNAEVKTNDAVFAADKKSAVLTLTDSKIIAGDYTVTLGGIDSAAIDKATASFVGEVEKVQKIEFVTASDTIAYAAKVIVKLKGVNQYGEAASVNAGNYDVYSSNNAVVKMNRSTTDSTLVLTLNTLGFTQGVGVVPVTVVNNDSHVTATKNFKVGTQPILTKLELGEARYSVGTSLSGKGENVKFDLNLFDQYGSMIPFDSLKTPVNDAVQVIWNDYLKDVSKEIQDNGDNIPELKLALTADVDKVGDYNFTAISQAASATGKISIGSAKLAAKVEIGQMNGVIAAGDDDVYVPIVAYDAMGKQLSIEDLTSEANVRRINVSVSGGTNPNSVSFNNGSGMTTVSTIEDSGEHKGTVHIKGISNSAKGAVSVTVFIATANVSSTATKTYTIQDARVPDHFKEVTAPAKAVVAGGYSKFEYSIIDQYDEVLDDAVNNDNFGNAVLSGSAANKYSVVVTATTYGSAASAYLGTDADHGTATPIATATYSSNVKDDFKKFNDVFRLITTSAAKPGDYVEYTAEIFENGTSLDKVTNKIVVADATDGDLNYNVAAIPTLFNTIDSNSVTDNVYYDGASKSTPTNTYSAQINAGTSQLAQEIKVEATNNAGDTVALPNQIISASSSDTSVARTALNSNGKGYVIGNKKGTATLNVTYKTLKGQIKQATLTVNVSDQPIAVASIKAGETARDVSKAAGISAPLAMDLTVYDSYNNKYEKDEISQYDYLLAVNYIITNLKGGAASVDQNGQITGDVGAIFDLTAVSANGKSATTSITIIN